MSRAKAEGIRFSVWSKEAAKLWHLLTEEELKILMDGIADVKR